MSAAKVVLGVVGVKSNSRRRQNGKALSAPFLFAEFRRAEMSAVLRFKRKRAVYRDGENFLSKPL